MNAFFYYFYTMMEHIVELFMEVVYAIWNLLVALVDIPYYIDVFKTYRGELTTVGGGGGIPCEIVHAVFRCEGRCDQQGNDQQK